ncbi:hypothetical protein [Lysobacter silvisoli]|uniref:Uncharacterized protein n=1 Tax=Lysobacter silvisoli TaxID=2293254 RepID=A0A371JWH5_9GAMM|nr:hypothetical protein [Lysobacter silvisoli]RDZ25937.1 hypothetical protein DX914_18905 [Lysobacter silvisoli]
MRTTAPLSLLLLLAAAPLAASTRSPAPAPNCLDARSMSEARQSGERTLAVMQADGRRFRVDLAQDCPAATVDAQATVLAREGWVCGHGNEYLRSGQQLCPVAAVAVIDAREYAQLALASQRRDDGIATLDAVEVKTEKRRGFGGSTSYCFNPRYMRGWSEDGKGLVVEVSPQRSGGHRYYRVELAYSCPELFNAHTIDLRSGMGISAICGNPGDSVVAKAEMRPGEGIARGGGVSRVTCPIASVYPIEQ